jgi:hypothetical protein
MNRKVGLFMAAILMVMPAVTFAAGLVPCGGAGEPVCEACYAVEMLNGLLDWLVGILTVVFALILVTAGINLVTSAGNVAAKAKAKSMISNAFVGFVIVLASWLLVDYGMKMLVSDEGVEVKLGTWNAMQCVGQPSATWVFHPVPDQSRGVAYTQNTDSGALAALEAPDNVLAGASTAAGLDAAQTRNLQALMRVESGGCREKVSPVGALGCMQIMPGTAKKYDQSLQSLNDAQVRDKLLNDDAYNIQLGAEIYADLYSRYNGNEQLVYAAYNGGPGSNEPSADCPGLRKWECVWDSPGCYDTQQTNCTPNTGYIETRDYVQKIPNVASQLP